MRSTLGLLFTYKKEDDLHQLVHHRSLSSIPYGCRYRVIDFMLSNMVNSGITKVGLLTQNHYTSLMDHVGSGKEWDLSRKRDGVFFLPPALGSNVMPNGYRGKLEALANSLHFLINSTEKYVLLGDGDAICNLTFDDMQRFHEEKDADITLLYKPGHFIGESFNQFCFLTLNADGRVVDVAIDPAQNRTKLAVGTLLIKRELLISLIRECASRNRYSFREDVLLTHLTSLKIYAYCFEGYYKALTTVYSYFDANMDLLRPSIRKELLGPQIYTKLRDEVPTVYRDGSEVSDSLLADGCVIEGMVKNSLIFRGVHIEAGASVENCIIMQDCVIHKNAKLRNVITDKLVEVNEGVEVVGTNKFPTVLEKGVIV